MRIVDSWRSTSLFHLASGEYVLQPRSLRQTRARQNHTKLLATDPPATSCARKELLINPAA